MSTPLQAQKSLEETKEIANTQDNEIPSSFIELRKEFYPLALDKIEELIEVDINAQDNYGNTALHFAVWTNNLFVVKMLLDKKANIYIQNRFGHTALHFAVGMGKSSIIQMLLNKGADINAQDVFEHTALHYAAWMDKLPIFNLLRKAGADESIKDIEGKTATQIAKGKVKAFLKDESKSLPQR